MLIESALLLHYPWDDSPKIQEKICHPESGPHWYFRRVKSPMRARAHSLIDFSSSPRALLFGSPHMDNYAKTDFGCGMIDFDRAYEGPTVWDCICFLLSLSLRQRENNLSPLPDEVIEHFYLGYFTGLELGEEPYTPFAPLLEKKPKRWQCDVASYVQAGKKWAKKMLCCPMSVNDPLLIELQRQYFLNLAESEDPTSYQLTQAGRCLGSLGRVHNILLLTHTESGEQQLIDIKHTRDYRNPNWAHDRFFTTEFEHDGQRMIYASNTLALGVTCGESFASVNGVQYWGRAVPLQNAKLKKNLTPAQLSAFAYSVGTQMGRGHVLTGEKKSLAAYMNTHKQAIEGCVVTITGELKAGWQNYQALLSAKEC